MNPDEQAGYKDAKAGSIDPKIYAHQGAQGTAYRNGIRQFNREEADRKDKEREREEALARTAAPVLLTRDCKACEGSGVNSRGDCCGPCGGRGYAPCTPTASPIEVTLSPVEELFPADKTNVVRVTETTIAAPPAPEDDQMALFEVEPDWKDVWRGMPDFVQDDLTPWQSLVVHFKNRADRANFSKLIGQTITDDTRSLWIPKAEITRYVDKRFKTERVVNPRHPIYIVSKGRFETRLTSDSLNRMGVPHYIVVEESEREAYASRVGPMTKVLVLDLAFKERYEKLDDLGMTKSTGPGPARNFAWEHAIKSGATWHWVMDDNIDGFYRLHNNIKTPSATGAIFRAMEDFCERYDNVGMAGPNYFMFASRKTVMPPFVLNTRIYSCNLIRNDVAQRWRGRYNEDTIISLDMLYAGLVTVQFNAFLQYKITTQTLGGGNSAEFYDKEGTRPKSEMLARTYPRIARVVEKFGRVHHHVNYEVFKNSPALHLRTGIAIGKEANNYGMELEMISDEARAAEAAKFARGDAEKPEEEDVA